MIRASCGNPRCETDGLSGFSDLSFFPATCAEVQPQSETTQNNIDTHPGPGAGQSVSLIDGQPVADGQTNSVNTQHVCDERRHRVPGTSNRNGVDDRNRERQFKQREQSHRRHAAAETAGSSCMNP